MSRSGPARAARWLTLVTLVAGLAACATDDEAGGTAQLGRMRASGFAMETAAPADRQIIRSADLTVEVDDLDAARTAAEADVAARKGQVESVYETEESLTLQLRIPAAQLDAFLAELKGLGKVKRASVSSQDVTEQHADLEVRLANSRKLRDRLRELLDKATTVEEMLAVEKELARVQSEVESLQGRLDRLESQVAMSSVSLTLERGRILGPLGYVAWGIWWAIEKLFVIR